jgi:two-component system response regulator FlrC
MDPSEQTDSSTGQSATRTTGIVDPVACASVSTQLNSLARRVAKSDCTVLVSGESGTGKEILARYIHQHSGRRTQPFVAVNCAAIPDNMLESLLFGWERGSFTGAHAAHSGKFEQAQSGTLLLDEVSEMPLPLQAKLLRVLQEHEVERLGGRQPIALDVRVIATTNRRLREEVQQKRFREDLYYRLNVFPLEIVALRSRREDIVPLAMRVLANHCRRRGRVPALHAEAAQRLLTHDWPGNVRELENVMQRALVLCDGDVITAEHLSFEPVAEAAALAKAVPPLAIQPLAIPPLAKSLKNPIQQVLPGQPDLAVSLAVAEQQIILEALRNGQGSRERLAERLGISPRTLRYKLARMRAAGIDVKYAAGRVA